MSYPTSTFKKQKQKYICKYTQHIKPEHGVLGHFFTGNQRDNCHIKYIPKRV